MPAPEAFEQHFGRHSLAFERPAFLRFTPRGDVSPAEMEQMGAFLIERTAALPYLLVLASLRDLGDVPAESRKISRRVMPQIPCRGLAYHGGSFQRRVLVKLILGAVQLLAPNPDVPVRFFDTEAEARAWLAERERELAAR